MPRLKDVPTDAQALLQEGRLEVALPPTCNSVAPGGALLLDTWEVIITKIALHPSASPCSCKHMS